MRYPAYQKYKPSGVKWLGDVPEHWEVKRGRFCMHVNPGSPQLRRLGPDDEVSFVPMETVGEYGGLNLELTRTLGENGTNYTEFQNGDVIVAKITPCFENGKGALAVGLTNGAALGTTELHVLRPLVNLERRFLFYITISSVYRKTGEAEMYGAGGQKRVPPEFNKNFRTPLPPLTEQVAIADFLDTETRKLDTLVAKRRELIEKLNEKRTALISRTVTRGLPPEAARGAGLNPHPKFKPSSIEWLGEIPEHWDVKPLKHVTMFINGMAFKPEEWSDEGVPIIRIENLNGGSDFNCFEGVVQKRYHVKKDDLLFGWSGNRGTSFGPFLWWREGLHYLNQHIFRFAGFSCDKVWFYWCLKAVTKAIEDEAHGIIGMVHVTKGKLGAVKIPAIALNEQRAIAAYLDSETEKIDQMIAKVEAAIERLQEYLTALITAAVTGKIDVREIAA